MENLTKVLEFNINDLKPYTNNPRNNNSVINKMVESIKEFGFRIPILCKSDGTVVDGHLRIKAAQKIGIKKIPVILADDLSEAQIKAFRIMVNKSVEWADWDEELLKQEFEALKIMDFNLSLTGFDIDEINSLIPSLEEQQELKEEEEEIKAFKKTHILLSFSPELFIKIQKHIDEIIKIEGVEYEQSSN